MQVLWNKEVEQIKDTGYLNAKISITDALIENFYQEIMCDEEKKLMKLVFSNNPTQDELNELLKIWDIEVKTSTKSLLLSYFQKRHPDLKFTSYEEARLKGLLRNYRFRNMQVISPFVKIGKVLNDNNVIPMILKGAAMKYLRQDLPRVMGDVDILVPEEDFMKTVNLTLPLGYYYEKIDVHSVDLHDKKTGKNVIDVHKFIYMGTKNDKKFIEDLFKRATVQNVFGVKALVPSHEDMMFIALVNLARNLRNGTSKAGLLYTLFDCKFFIEDKPDFDWNIIKTNAKKTGTEVQTNFAMKFINRISKDVFPKEIQDDMLFEKLTNDYSNMVMFKRFYLEDLRNKCRALKVSDIFKSYVNFRDYIFLKPKYQFLKLLVKHPKLIGLLIRDLKTKQYDFATK